MGIAWSGFKSVWSCIKYVLNFLYQAYLHFQTASDLFQKMLPMPTPKLPDISVDQYSLNSGQTYSKDDCINMFSSKFQLSNIYQNWVGKCCLDEPQIYCNCFEDENTRQLVLSSCPYLLEKKFDSTCFHITNHTKNQYKITNPILPESDNNVLIVSISIILLIIDIGLFIYMIIMIRSLKAIDSINYNKTSYYRPTSNLNSQFDNDSSSSSTEKNEQTNKQKSQII